MKDFITYNFIVKINTNYSILLHFVKIKNIKINKKKKINMIIHEQLVPNINYHQ